MAAIFAGSRQNQPDTFRMNVYYFNPNVFRLESLEHRLPYGDEFAWLETAVRLFANTSRIPAMTGVWPDGEGFLVDWRMDGDVFEAVFPMVYRYIPPLEEALFRAAFVWTMTGLPYVNQVRILVEGDDPDVVPPVTESRNTVVIDPVISSVRLTTRTFTLYFLNDDFDALVPVPHTSSTVDMDQIEKYIVARLIEGPDMEGLTAAIPPETRIIDIVSEENTCYVDLSSEFVSRFNGSTAMARLMVYTIVNSLTDNLTHVRRVQFLIDSERVDQFHGMTDFHQVFEWDETLLAGQ
jgi:germination protein M